VNRLSRNILDHEAEVGYTFFLFVLVPVCAVLAQQQQGLHIIRVVAFSVFMSGY
jgi:hypothetical protein